MNHNKYKARMFNPKRHAKRKISNATKLWMLDSFVLASIVTFVLMGWV